MVILTGIDGLEIRELKFIKVDVDLSDTKDFEIQIPASEWSSDLEYKGRVFIPGTEYGGRIGGKGASTQKDVRTTRDSMGMAIAAGSSIAENAAGRTAGLSAIS